MPRDLDYLCKMALSVAKGWCLEGSSLPAALRGFLPQVPPPPHGHFMGGSEHSGFEQQVTMTVAGWIDPMDITREIGELLAVVLDEPWGWLKKTTTLESETRQERGRMTCTWEVLWPHPAQHSQVPPIILGKPCAR